MISYTLIGVFSFISYNSKISIKKLNLLVLLNTNNGSERDAFKVTFFAFMSLICFYSFWTEGGVTIN